MSNRPTIGFAEALQKAKVGRSCNFALAVQNLSKEDARLLNEALAADPREISTAAIIRALREIGCLVSRDAALNHRKGLCSCVIR